MSYCIELPDGSFKSFSSCPTALEVAHSISSQLGKKAVGALINQNPTIQDIRSSLQDKDKLQIITLKDEKSLEVIRHSSAHVLAQAVQNLWPQVKVTIGPVIETGFYYDFDTDKKFVPEDLEKIEKEMKKILQERYELKREVWSSRKACDFFEKKGELLKKEIIEDLGVEEVSIYKQGDWLDLCRGPHVQHLGQIGAVKVLSQSGAYWRGDSSKKQLQRIYGTAFHSEKRLKDFLHKMELAKQNDHRLLGKKLNLFWFSDLSPGNPFFTPSGTVVYQKMQAFLREKYQEYAYQEVISPQIYYSDLFKMSGHLGHYSDNMYSVGEGHDKGTFEQLKQKVFLFIKQHPEGIKTQEVSEKAGLPHKMSQEQDQKDSLAQFFLEDLKGEGLITKTERGQWKAIEGKTQENPLFEDKNISFLKPMNCPGHCLLYKKDRWSYKNLPWRVADFGRLHRREATGALQGLTRVKSFCQDDAHVFCRMDQLASEIQQGIEMLQDIYQVFGLNDYKIELSTRPEKRMGEESLWDSAEQSLVQVLKNMNLAFELEEGEGAFYGPKLDIKVKDAFDRFWQLGTFQCDFNLPQAFSLSYVNEKDQEERPVLLHRAILGSLERFFGLYLEHCKGRFPTWLQALPVVILPLSEKEQEFCLKVKKKLEQKEILCKIDSRNEKLSYKIREHQTQQIPYMIVIGKKEVESQKLSVRLRTGELFSAQDIESFAKGLSQEMKGRASSSFLINKDSAY